MKRALVIAGAALALGPGSSRAQQSHAVQPEARVDVFVARNVAVQGGLGASIAVDRNVRVDLVGGLGSAWSHEDAELSARTDAVLRFLFDPDFTSRWAPYAGGGVGARYERGPGWRGVLIAIIGVEGPRWSSFVPFFEAGYGGGARLGFGVRRARDDTR